MSTAVEVWTRLLDDMECRLAAQRADVDRGATITPIGFTPPANLPPLPAECLERARLVHSSNADLIAVVGTTIRQHPGGQVAPGVRSTVAARATQRFRIDLEA